MKEQRQVFEALAKIAKPQKEELSSEKVELAKISDLDFLAKDVTRINNKVLDQNRKLRNELEGLKSASRVALGLISDYERIKKELESAAKDLGFDISTNIKGPDQLIKVAEQDIKDVKKRWGI